MSESEASAASSSPGLVPLVLGSILVVTPWFLATLLCAVCTLFLLIALVADGGKGGDGEFYLLAFAGPFMIWSCAALIAAFWYRKRGKMITVGLLQGLALSALLLWILHRPVLTLLVGNKASPWVPDGTSLIFGLAVSAFALFLGLLIRQRRENLI